jgi:hypothetical protein
MPDNTFYTEIQASINTLKLDHLRLCERANEIVDHSPLYQTLFKLKEEIKELQAIIEPLHNIKLQENETLTLIIDFMFRNGITPTLLLTRLMAAPYQDYRKWTKEELDKIFSEETSIKSIKPFTYGTRYIDQIQKQLGIWDIHRDTNNKLTYSVYQH